MPRIALIRATPVVVQPVADAFAAGWLEVFVTNLLDDSLSPDLEARGKIDDALIDRFLTLGRYTANTGADGILFTCSAFGLAIEAVANELYPLPVLKPNEATFEDALSAGDRLGMLATFKLSIPPMETEFRAMSREKESKATLKTHWVEGAMDALRAGDAETHNGLIAEAAPDLSGCDTGMLAHFSTSQARQAVADVLSSPSPPARSPNFAP